MNTATLTELEMEARNLTSDLNDPDNIMDSEWRAFLEAKREDVWAQIKALKS